MENKGCFKRGLAQHARKRCAVQPAPLKRTLDLVPEHMRASVQEAQARLTQQKRANTVAKRSAAQAMQSDGGSQEELSNGARSDMPTDAEDEQGSVGDDTHDLRPAAGQAPALSADSPKGRGQRTKIPKTRE